MSKVSSKAAIETLVSGVKEFANANYNKSGWDYIVECCSDSDIRAIVEGCWTVSGAITRVGKVAKAYDQNRKEIMATAF